MLLNGALGNAPYGSPNSIQIKQKEIQTIASHSDFLFFGYFSFFVLTQRKKSDREKQKKHRLLIPNST
jgi:hypothetical protein